MEFEKELKPIEVSWKEPEGNQTEIKGPRNITLIQGPPATLTGKIFSEFEKNAENASSRQRKVFEAIMATNTIDVVAFEKNLITLKKKSSLKWEDIIPQLEKAISTVVPFTFNGRNP